MMREGGASLQDVFDQVRLRVSDATKGAVVPWDADRVDANFVFFERAPGAPAPSPTVALSNLRDRPLGSLGAAEAYQAALDRDTIAAYQDFLAAYPHDRAARRVRAILAARREALIWRRTLENGTADAYWSYLRGYPEGPHAIECRLYLSRLAASAEPPPDFAPIDYGLPPPPSNEVVIVDRPVLMFADPDFDLAPPPPVVVLEPPPQYIVDLPPPPPPEEAFVLPTPVYEPLPVWVDRPAYVAPPPVNIIAYNIHNTVIVNQNAVLVKDRTGRPVPPLANAVAAGVIPPNATFPPAVAAPGQPPQAQIARPVHFPPNLAPGAAAFATGAATLRVALPPSVAARVQHESGVPRAAPGARALRNAGPATSSVGVIPPRGQRVLPGRALPGQPTATPLPSQSAPLGQQPALQVQQQQRQRALQLQQQQRTQQLEQQKALQVQQQRALQLEQQQKGQRLDQQKALQVQQQRALQLQQQQKRQRLEQQKALQVQQQRALQAQQQQKGQRLEQQKALQLQQQQKGQRLDQQKALQVQQQQRALQLQQQQQAQQQRALQAQQQQQRVLRAQQQRALQLRQQQQAQQQQRVLQAQQQQRALQAQQQQRALQAQQQQRALQAQQQRALQAQQQQRALQLQQQQRALQVQSLRPHPAPGAPSACGRPGLPPCR